MDELFAAIKEGDVEGGFTPLLAAAHHDDGEMAELLLRHGADRTLAAGDGRDPAAMAGPRVAELLLARSGTGKPPGG